MHGACSQSQLAMFRGLQIVSVLLVAIAMALALAHALELPGKLRLDRDAYLTVQRIYYPGFTVGGVSEIAGIIALVALTWGSTFDHTRLWWTFAALVLLMAMHATYWFVTHPVNNFWLKDVELSGLGATFFSAFAGNAESDWTKLRDVWEYSHVARAIFGMLSLLSLTIAVTR
jgi:hypothetical protein